MNHHFQSAINSLNQTILGKESQIKLAITCLLANGHLLIEDLPGMGKTTLSHALAVTFGLDFSRIQFTSDLLPADMLGVSIFNAQEQSFSFKKGPIFNQVVLADEINRASPKTQSALLESMEENQVTVDGNTYSLPQPFFVIATQNPSFQSGTYPLPESQLDRFLMRISLGYPSPEAEKAMLQSENRSRLSSDTVMNAAQLADYQMSAQGVHASDAILNFILRLVTNSREASFITNPLSPRASKALMNASKAWAYIHGRDFVMPEDVQAVFSAVAEHRLRAGNIELDNGTAISQRLLDMTDPLAA